MALIVSATCASSPAQLLSRRLKGNVPVGVPRGVQVGGRNSLLCCLQTHCESFAST